MKLKFILPTLLFTAAIPIVAVSCGANNQSGSTTNKVVAFEDANANVRNKLDTLSSGFGSNIVLSQGAYNSLYDKMGAKDVALAIIANHKIYEQIVPFHSGDKIWDILARSGFEFKIHETPMLGKFINTFKLKGAQDFMGGTRTDENYGDKYPLYYINHKFAQFGVSNWTSSAREVYEFTYDDK